jgi:hypothetical protein
MLHELPARGRPADAPRPGRTPRLWPGRLTLLLHLIKTCRLIARLLLDGRIAFWRKALFLLACAALFGLLFFSDLLGELVASTLLPLLGSVLGLPLDAGGDWLVFVMVVVSLLRLFPPEIVSEEYRRIFRKD